MAIFNSYVKLPEGMLASILRIIVIKEVEFPILNSWDGIGVELHGSSGENFSVGYSEMIFALFATQMFPV